MFQGDEDIDMEEDHPGTISENSNSPPPGFSSNLEATHELPLTGVNPDVALQPGETLIIHHPHSQCPMHIIPTVELHSHHTTRHDVKMPEASYAPFPTRADFEQAEIFVNNNCSNGLIDTQLKFANRNGMHLNISSSRQMHKLLAHGVEEGLTNDSKVGAVRYTVDVSHMTFPSSVKKKSQFLLFKADLRKNEHTQFATVPRWRRCSAPSRILTYKMF
jgi:hypothetical protein